MFYSGFPYVDNDIVNRVINLIPLKRYYFDNLGVWHKDKPLPDVYYTSPLPLVTEDNIEFTLGQHQILFPYRLYAVEIEGSVLSKMNFIERIILHCIYSRSCNGFVREKHITALLAEDFPDWVIPYIIKVCDEYVVEILQVVYDNLKGKNTDKFKNFCAENKVAFCKSYSRMISYWNEFHRNNCYGYKDYVGRKLFIECFGARRNMT